MKDYTPIPLAGDTQVNTTTEELQLKPDIAALPDGGYIIIWATVLATGDPAGIFAQRYDENGNPQGGEFQVNTTEVISGVLNPSVTHLQDGGFVITWDAAEQPFNPFNNNGDIRGQRYDTDGVAQGGEFLVNTTISGNQRVFDIEVLADGSFIVAWDGRVGDGSTSDIAARKFNADGSPAGDEFLVNASYTASGQSSPQITALSNGGYVITFGSSGPVDNSFGGISAVIFNPDGTIAKSIETVNTTTINFQSGPSVAELANGDFVIVWQSLSTGGNQDGNGAGIFGQRFTASGTAVGDEFQVNTYTDDNQLSPEIIGLNDGGFLVTWESEGQDGDGKGVFGQRFDNSGTAIGDEFQINFITDATQSNISITVLENGQLVATYRSDGEVFSRTFDLPIYEQPLPLGNAVEVNPLVTGAEFNADIAAFADGTYIVVMERDPDIGTSNSNVYGQRFDADGNPLGDEFLINTFGTTGNTFQFDASISILANEGFVVTWTSSNQDGGDDGIYGQRFDANGNPVGGEFQVNTTTGIDLSDSTTVALDDGGFVVTWSDDTRDPVSSKIFVIGQRFDANGVKVGSEFQIAGASLNSVSSISSLEDGGFVITWAGAFAGNSGLTVIAQRFDSNGSEVGSAFQVNTTFNNRQNQVDIAGLEDGGFIITWTTETSSNSSIVLGQRYDVNGVAVGDEFQISIADFVTNSNSSIAALADGGFVVTWDFTPSGNGLYGQRYDADGNTLGGVFFIDSTGDDAEIVTLADGNIAIVYNDDGQKFFTQIIEVPANGFYGDDTTNALMGTSGADFIKGYNGADNLDGLDGDDTLNGDAGADTLNGGEGDDTLDGGVGSGDVMNGEGGNDLIYGGFGNDMIDGGAGIDTVNYSGFGGNITVNLNQNGNPQTSGGGGVDVITNVENIIGGDFADRLTGRGGDSEIHGGAGGDRIFGLGGVDMLFGESANDFIQGGNGDDFIDGGAGQDQLNGGNDNDIILGGEGNDLDRLTGAAGDDTLDGGGGRDILRGDSFVAGSNVTGGSDIFDFNEVNDSLTGGLRDIIRDFVQGEDLMDLSDVDAITGGADDAFTFIGTDSFSNTAGEMRYQFGGSNTVLSMDVDGDGSADMQIQLNGNIDLIAGDFIL